MIFHSTLHLSVCVADLLAVRTVLWTVLQTDTDLHTGYNPVLDKTDGKMSPPKLLVEMKTVISYQHAT